MRILTTREEADRDGARADMETRREVRGATTGQEHNEGAAQGEGGAGAASTGRRMGTEEESNITGAASKARRRARKTRGQMTYLQQVKPVFERLMGQLELALMGGLEEVTDIRTDSEWGTVDCPALVRMFVNKQRGFARFVLEAASHEEAVGSLMTL
jgi:hypothetical protein